MSTILPEEWIEVTNTFNNMYQYKMALSNENIKRKVDHELSNQIVLSILFPLDSVHDVSIS